MHVCNFFVPLSKQGQVSDLILLLYQVLRTIPEKPGEPKPKVFSNSRLVAKAALNLSVFLLLLNLDCLLARWCK